MRQRHNHDRITRWYELMKRVVITGANGYLATLVQTMNDDNCQFIPVTRKDVDLEAPEQVAQFFQGLDFDVVFHCAARTQTADCEANPVTTHKVNTDSAIKIAEVCQAKGARFVFLSTEQVFNGVERPGPFTEADVPYSISVYGQQKIEVEEYLAASSVDFVILRLSWMMGMSYPGISASPNLIKNTMNALFYQKETLFTKNEIRGITYAKKMAEQFAQLITLPKGIYHFSGTNPYTTYESAKLIAEKLGFTPQVYNQYILPDHKRYADRFRDYRLSNQKITQAGIQLADFEQDVETCLKDFGWLA